VVSFQNWHKKTAYSLWSRQLGLNIRKQAFLSCYTPC